MNKRENWNFGKLFKNGKLKIIWELELRKTIIK